MTAALLLGGCEKVLDVDFDDVTPQVVVMSSVQPDTTVNVRLTYSRFILDDSPFRTVDDAVLSLEVNGVDVPYVIGPRRDGDLPEVYANAEKALRVLGWRAEKTVDDMCRDSWGFIRTRAAEG